MKRVVVIALLALTLPMAAFATSMTDYGNTGGTLTASASGVTITSTLTSIFPQGGSITTGNLGTVNITSGAMTIGSFPAGGTFGAGTITITNTSNAVLFSGTFSSATLTLMPTGADGSHEYQFYARVRGGSTTQTTFDVGNGFFGGGTA